MSVRPKAPSLGTSTSGAQGVRQSSLHVPVSAPKGKEVVSEGGRVTKPKSCKSGSLAMAGLRGAGERVAPGKKLGVKRTNVTQIVGLKKGKLQQESQLLRAEQGEQVRMELDPSDLDVDVVFNTMCEGSQNLDSISQDEVMIEYDDLYCRIHDHETNQWTG